MKKTFTCSYCGKPITKGVYIYRWIEWEGGKVPPGLDDMEYFHKKCWDKRLKERDGRI